MPSELRGCYMLLEPRGVLLPELRDVTGHLINSFHLSQQREKNFFLLRYSCLSIMESIE